MRELQSIENDGCKLRSMRPLAIGVDIASAVVVVSATLSYHARVEKCAALRSIDPDTLFSTSALPEKRTTS